MQEIEKTMGKTRDLFKKTRDAKEIFHANMGTNKGQKWYGLNRSTRWQQYKEELYKNDLNAPDTHNDVTTHIKPDILECEVKWALGSITAQS